MSANYPILMEREKSEVIYNISTWFALGAKRANLKKYTAYKILTITFVNNKNVPNTAEASWDVSLNEDGSIIAWVIPNSENEEKYDFFIGADSEKITATQSTTSESEYEGEYKIFYGYAYCFEINNLSMLDTSQIEDFNNTFGGDGSLTSLDLSNFNTSNATNMKDMFSSCHNLTSLDLSKFNTSNVTNMNGMFSSCSELASLNVGNFDTSKVTNMNSMFYSCSNLTSLDLSNFDTSKVTDMAGMFIDCSKFTSLDVSNFNTSNVTNMKYMFRDCGKLTTIYCNNNWKTDKITDSLEMFYGCSNLKGAISYDETKVDVNYANPDTGYFSYLPTPAIPFLANLDIRQNQIKNVVIDKLKQAPTSPVLGQVYYNTTDNKTYTYNGTTWDMLTNESEILYIPYKNEYTTDDYNEYYPKVVSAIQNHNNIYIWVHSLMNGYDTAGFVPLYSYTYSENELSLLFFTTILIGKSSGNTPTSQKFQMRFFTTDGSMELNVYQIPLVREEEGKGLSTNDYTNEDKQAVQDNTTARHTHSNKNILDTITASYTTEEKNKLAGIEAGAQVNTVASVNSKTGAVTLTASDVGALPADTTIPTKTSDLQNDSNFISSSIVTSFWQGTQNEYDTLENKDTTTLYMIIEG